MHSIQWVTMRVTIFDPHPIPTVVAVLPHRSPGLGSHVVRLVPIAALISLALSFGALPASADAVDSAVAAARGTGLATQSDAEATANASAARQAAAQNISHASISHLTSVCSRAAEIVGVGPSLDLIFAGFRASPNHWAKLTDPGWTSMGTGAAEGADGRLYVSVVFCAGAGGTPAPAPAPSPPPVQPPVARPQTPPDASSQRASGGPTPPNVASTSPVFEVDLVGLITAILTTSLDSLTSDDSPADPVAVLQRHVWLTTGPTIV